MLATVVEYSLEVLFVSLLSLLPHIDNQLFRLHTRQIFFARSIKYNFFCVLLQTSTLMVLLYHLPQQVQHCGLHSIYVVLGWELLYHAPYCVRNFVNFTRKFMDFCKLYHLCVFKLVVQRMPLQWNLLVSLMYCALALSGKKHCLSCWWSQCSRLVFRTFQIKYSQSRCGKQNDCQFPSSCQ